MISVIIVSYNTKKFITACLESVRKYAPMGTEVIVVDNASTDDSVDTLRSMRVRLIKNQENVGFAKAVNQGIRVAKGEFFFLLNPDTKITEGTFDELMEFSETHTDAGVIAPQLLNTDGSLQPSCYHEPTLIAAIKEYFWGIKNMYQKYAPQGKGATRVDAVVGAAMFFPKKIITNIGMFDERYFMYFEDLDFCRRVRNAGFLIYYLPTVRVYHEHGGVTRTVPEKAKRWLIESSKVYHGVIKHSFLTLILWLGQKWRKLFS